MSDGISQLLANYGCKTLAVHKIKV